jgi:hypothetical protein
MLHFRMTPFAVVTWRCETAPLEAALPSGLRLLARDGRAWLSLVLAGVRRSRLLGVPLTDGSEAILRTYVDGPRGPGVFQLRLASNVPWVLAARFVNGAIVADHSLAVVERDGAVSATGCGLDVLLAGRARVPPAEAALVSVAERGYISGPLGQAAVVVVRPLTAIDPIAIVRLEAEASQPFAPTAGAFAVVVHAGEWKAALPRRIRRPRGQARDGP